MSQDTDNPTLDALDAVTLVFDANENVIEGRTVLQKLVYFVSQRVTNSEISYVPHRFGPFSAEVASLLADLCIAGRAYEVCMQWGDRKGYKYVMTDYGQEVTKISLDIHSPETVKTIRDILNTCKNECSLRHDDLSYAAKVHYVLTNYAERRVSKRPQTVHDIHDVAYRFGWNLTDENTRTGHALLRKLHLVHDSL